MIHDMNRKSWLSILITALVGVLLIVFYNQGQILTWVVTLFGVCLIIPAAYNLYSTLRVPVSYTHLDVYKRQAYVAVWYLGIRLV